MFILGLCRMFRVYLCALNRSRFGMGVHVHVKGSVGFELLAYETNLTYM